MLQHNTTQAATPTQHKTTPAPPHHRHTLHSTLSGDPILGHVSADTHTPHQPAAFQRRALVVCSCTSPNRQQQHQHQLAAPGGSARRRLASSHILMPPLDQTGPAPTLAALQHLSGTAVKGCWKRPLLPRHCWSAAAPSSGTSSLNAGSMPTL